MRAKVRNDRVSAKSYGLIVILGLLCLSVLAQMLGMPGSLIDLLPHSDTTVASISEDVSLNPLMVEPNTPGLSQLRVIFQPSVQLPVLVTSVFHPPQT
jgi:hypothetical protein